jgi:uncharacterized protein (TIGR03083 family)
VEGQPGKLAQAGTWYLQTIDAIPADAWTKPSRCEGWSVTTVVAHVTTGDQLFRAVVLDATGQDRAGEDLPADFADRQRRFQALSTWEGPKLREAAHKASDQMVAAVSEAVDKTPQMLVTVPYGTVPMPVVRNLRVNEYIIHGYDLMPAIGQAIPIPDWFIDRALGDSIALTTRLHQRSPHKGKSASFHIHRTDGDGEWVLQAGDGQSVVESGHRKADVAMRGPGEGLYWVLMGRGKPQDHGVEVHGDPALAAAFKEWFPGP